MKFSLRQITLSILFIASVCTIIIIKIEPADSRKDYENYLAEHRAEDSFV